MSSAGVLQPHKGASETPSRPSASTPAPLQPHKGASETKHLLGLGDGLGLLQPHKGASETSRPQGIKQRLAPLQPHKGASETGAGVDACRACVLQPHKGASETRGTAATPSSTSIDFNPTRVRLKHQRGGEPVGVSYNFNPTRVRLKLSMETVEDTIEYTSTPQGCV